MTAARDRAAARLAQEIAAHLRDDDEFTDTIAVKVAQHVEAEFAMVSPQGWHMEPVYPPWSGHCWHGDHDLCDGSAGPAETGCACPHHKGESIPKYGYRMWIDDNGDVQAEPRTEPPPRWPRRDPPEPEAQP